VAVAVAGLEVGERRRRRRDRSKSLFGTLSEQQAYVKPLTRLVEIGVNVSLRITARGLVSMSQSATVLYISK
jgi:hypothetical protein